MADLVDQTDERGMAVSPTLPEGKKNFLIDIDGTICEDIPNEEPELSLIHISEPTRL